MSKSVQLGQKIVIVWISVFIAAMLLIYTCFMVQLRRNSNKISWFYKLSSTLCLSCCLLSSIGDLIHMIQAYTNNIPSSDTAHLFQIIIVADVFYYIASLSLYIYVLAKPYATFQSTAYSVSKYYIIFILMLLFILTVSMIGYLYTVSTCPALEFYEKSEKYLFSLIITDAMIDSSILILFVYKLQQLLSNSMRADDVLMDVMLRHGKKSVNLNGAQNRMITLITKQTILGTVIILFNSTFFIKTLIDHFVVNESSYTAGIAFETTYGLRSIENTVILTMVYLNFSFGSSLYYNMCNYIHSGCYKCCLKCITRKVDSTINQPSELEGYHMF